MKLSRIPHIGTKLDKMGLYKNLPGKLEVQGNSVGPGETGCPYEGFEW